MDEFREKDYYREKIKEMVQIIKGKNVLKYIYTVIKDILVKT